MYAAVLTSVTLLAALFSDCRGDARIRKSTARQCIKKSVSGQMIRELQRNVIRMESSLPRDNNRHQRLLPNFRSSLKNRSGLSVIKELLDFYFSDVMCNEPLNVMEQEDTCSVLNRMINEVQQCLRMHPSSLSPRDQNQIRIMTKTFHQLTNGKAKAVGEFKIVLFWIESYKHRKKSKIKKQ